MSTIEPSNEAKSAGLRYTSDAIPGIERIKRGASFAYRDARGRIITETAEISRISALAIPPAYTNVWISPYANGHLQATGRDARGRKQYRYHARWRGARDETKFDRMIAFAKALPTIRAALRRDLARSGLPREKVLASVVQLLERTAIRVGNEEYARDNASYGLTTMRARHVRIEGETIRFRFRGKSGKHHEITVKDRRLARVVRDARELPGRHLFEYLDDTGAIHPIHSDDVNAYLREISHHDFTAKDFRTWEGTMLCALRLGALRAEGVSEARRLVNETIAEVAQHLGNTPAVCKKSYIYPGIVDTFVRNGAIALVQRSVKRATPHALHADEAAVIRLVEEIIAKETAPLDDLLAKSVTAEQAKRKRSGSGRPKRTKALAEAGLRRSP